MKKLNIIIGSTATLVALMAGSTILGNQRPTETVKSTPTEVAIPNGYVENNGTYDCTSDCSGHEAGYDWAEEYEICDPDYDNGNSDSFNEGVIAWGRDNCLANEE